MISVERTEADVRTAAAEGVGNVPGCDKGQDVIASPVGDEDPLFMIETPEGRQHPGRKGDHRGEQLRVREAERQGVARTVGEAEEDDVRRVDRGTLEKIAERLVEAMRVKALPRLVLRPHVLDQVPGLVERMRRDQNHAEFVGERLHLLKEALRIAARAV